MLCWCPSGYDDRLEIVRSRVRVPGRGTGIIFLGKVLTRFFSAHPVEFEDLRSDSAKDIIVRMLVYDSLTGGTCYV